MQKQIFSQKTALELSKLLTDFVQKYTKENYITELKPTKKLNVNIMRSY